MGRSPPSSLVPVIIARPRSPRSTRMPQNASALLPARRRAPARYRALALAVGASFALSAATSGCGGDPPRTYAWQPVATDANGALLSVWGTSERDVYVVGADSRDGYGPTALHYDGTGWTRMDT